MLPLQFSRCHIFSPIIMKLGQNYFLNEISDKFGNGSYRVKIYVTGSNVGTRIIVHVCVCARARTHTHTHTHTHARAHARTHARTHTHTHARTHAHAQAHSRTRTHTHNQVPYRLHVFLEV